MLANKTCHIVTLEQATSMTKFIFPIYEKPEKKGEGLARDVHHYSTWKAAKLNNITYFDFETLMLTSHHSN